MQLTPFDELADFRIYLLLSSQLSAGGCSHSKYNPVQLVEENLGPAAYRKVSTRTEPLR